MIDLIKREDVMALWDKYHYDIATRAVEFDKDLRKIPSAEPKQGKWIFQRNYTWACSECGKNPTEGMGYVQRKEELFNYCPSCGSRMQG